MIDPNYLEVTPIEVPKFVGFEGLNFLLASWINKYSSAVAWWVLGEFIDDGLIAGRFDPRSTQLSLAGTAQDFPDFLERRIDILELRLFTQGTEILVSGSLDRGYRAWLRRDVSGQVARDDPFRPAVYGALLSAKGDTPLNGTWPGVKIDLDVFTVLRRSSGTIDIVPEPDVSDETRVWVKSFGGADPITGQFQIVAQVFSHFGGIPA